MPDLRDEVNKVGLFHQFDNDNGFHYSKVYNKEDYEPNKYTLDGNPINWGLSIEFDKARREEFITITLIPEETNDPGKYGEFQKALYLYAKKGNMYHDKFIKKRSLLMWEDGMRDARYPHSTVKITTAKGEANLLIHATVGLQDKGLVTQIPCFSSVIMEEINAQEVKVRATGNNLAPDYNDLVFTVTSALTPITEMIKVN